MLLPAKSGQGLQISGKLTRREGKVFYNLKFDNHTQMPLDKFMIQFNKNTFGLAAGGPLQVHVLICLFEVFSLPGFLKLFKFLITMFALVHFCYCDVIIDFFPAWIL